MVANHVSWLDGALVGLARRGHLVVKGEGTDWPPALRGPLLRLGTVFLDRGRPETLPDTIAELTAVLRAGGRVIAFPEGTSYCGIHRGTFHPALFQSAVDAGAVVRPAEIRYRLADHTTATSAAFIGDDDFGTSLARIVATRGLTAQVTFRPAVPPSDRRALARAAQDSVFGADTEIDSTSVEAGQS